jgi:aminobenzoyl-glutamate utilization protein A
MHDCEVDVESVASAPSAVSDTDIADIVGAVASGVDGVDSVLPSDTLGGSEDATFLMRHVQERGGKAAYVVVGTDHPTGHHTPRFDVDEESIRIGIETLAGSIERIAAERP